MKMSEATAEAAAAEAEAALQQRRAQHSSHPQRRSASVGLISCECSHYHLFIFVSFIPHSFGARLARCSLSLSLPLFPPLSLLRLRLAPKQTNEGAQQPTMPALPVLPECAVCVCGRGEEVARQGTFLMGQRNYNAASQLAGARGRGRGDRVATV